MRYCVKPCLAENQPTHNFMEVDAVVERQFVRKAHVT